MTFKRKTTQLMRKVNERRADRGTDSREITRRLFCQHAIYARPDSRAAEHERSLLCFGKWHHIFSAIVFLIFLYYASGILYGEFKPRVAVETLY